MIHGSAPLNQQAASVRRILLSKEVIVPPPAPIEIPAFNAKLTLPWQVIAQPGNARCYSL